MFIPQLDHLEKIVAENDLLAMDKLLVPNNRVQNKQLNFTSALMLSAHNLKHLLKIEKIDADCVMLNLEDGVSAEQKPMALRLCAFFLSKISQSDKKLVVRVNPLDEGGMDEISFLNPFKPDAIRVPKVRTHDDVLLACETLDEHIQLHLSIETKEAFLNLHTLQHHNRVKAVYLGVLDLLADLGLNQSIIQPNNPTMQYLLAEFLIKARAINTLPISFVYQDYANLNVFEQWLNIEKSMGFRAKGTISPKQSSLAMKVLQHDDDDKIRARYIIDLFEKMQKQGVTGFSDDKYGFIDEPIYKGALRVLDQDYH